MKLAILGGLLFLLAVAPLAGWTQAGVYLEFTLPDGSSYRFGPLVLAAGDIVAPGFYKLVLNGSGYVEFNTTPTAGTIAALVRPYKTPDWNAIASNDEALSWRLYVSQASDNYEFMRRNASLNAYVASDGPAVDGALTWVVAYTYSDRLEVNNGSASWPGNPAQPVSRILIGSNMYNGTELAAQRWVGEIWAVVIHSTPGVDPRSYVIPASGLELLFDPSWYNGSSFIAISGNGFIEGRLVGTGVLEGTQPRLWVVRGAYSDGYLHVSLTPYGTELKILDANGNVAEYTVIGDSSGGLVLDYPIPWPPPHTAANPSTRPDVLAWLAVPLVLAALAAPAIAWYSGLVGGLTASLVSGVAGWLALREYAASTGADRDVWLGLGLISITMLILAFAISIMRATDSYTRKLKTPKGLDIG